MLENLCVKTIQVQNIFCPKKFWHQELGLKNFGSNFFFGQMLVPKNFKSKRILGAKKLGQNNFRPKRLLGEQNQGVQI